MMAEVIMKKTGRGKRKLSRRSFIVASTGAAGVTGNWPQSGGTQKYTIVGAGIAGLYAAWRLVVQSKYADPSEICILEMSNRIGGPCLFCMSFGRQIHIDQ
jgi:predicted NAD/FAD-binding protein